MIDKTCLNCGSTWRIELDDLPTHKTEITAQLRECPLCQREEKQEVIV